MNARPAGRRPGDPDVTRAAILAAARQQFTAVGFDRATIRAIASDADVDPALITHHFTNKRQLFVAAHELPGDPSQIFADVAELPPDERAGVVASRYLTMALMPGSPMTSLMRTAATDPDVSTMLRQFITSALVDLAPRFIEGPDVELRAAMLGSHLIGLIFARELIGIDALQSVDVDELVELITPALDRYITG